MNRMIGSLLTIGCLALGGRTMAADDTKTSEPVVMKAGVAKAVISPDEKDYKKLVTVMGTHATRKDHDIYARVLTLFDGTNRLAIVTYDLNCLDVATPILRKRCRDELHLPPSHLILLGTHNHAAPIQIVPANFEYGRWLAKRIFELISESIQKEKGPAQVWLGTGNDYDVIATGNAPADPEIEILKVTVAGKPLALFFNHPTHPMQSSQRHIDTGHPGYAVDFLEEAMPGVQAMYVDACGGNQFPDRGLRMSGTMQQVKDLGKELSENVLKIASGDLKDVSGKIVSKLEIISLPLAPPLSYEEAKKLAEKKHVPLNIGLVPYPHRDRESNWIRMLLKHYEEHIPFPKRTTDRVCTDDAFLVRDGELPDKREFPCRYEEVIVSKIGPLCFVGMQGEVCAPIGMRIKDALRRKTPLFVTAYMSEHNLYIPTREIVRQDAYQAQVIRIQYACPVSWAPEVEDEMVKGVLNVVTEVTGIQPLRSTR
jgi:neutral ceramidase